MPGRAIKTPPSFQPGSWHVYIVRCRDNTFYTGITTNLDKRIADHNSSDRGARYTRGRRPVTLVYHEQSGSRATATRREHQIKQLPAIRKIRLIAEQNLQESHDIHSDS